MQDVGKRRRCGKNRETGAPALGGGGNDDGPPVRKATLGAGGIEPDLAAGGEDGTNGGGAEFDRFLEHPFHARGARDRGHKRDREPRFGFVAQGLADDNGRARAGRGEPRAVFVALAVEDEQRGAPRETQHAGEAMGLVARQFSFIARGDARQVNSGEKLHDGGYCATADRAVRQFRSPANKITVAPVEDERTVRAEYTNVDAEGWLAGARHRASPHCDERPADARITLVVVHGVSLPPGEFGGPWVEDFFTGRLDYRAHDYFASIRELRVAPHLLIRRDGEVVQFVSFVRRAWHAGRSSWRGREACNDYSIGIELEGSDTVPYTDAQYAALEAVLPVLAAAYPGLREDGVTGHADVAPTRKSDPGPAFDWARLGECLRGAGCDLPLRGRIPDTAKAGSA